jgi:ankyrin repeat protein
VDDQAVDGTTALHIACQKGIIEMVSQLVMPGSAKDYQIHRQYAHVPRQVRLLLERGADVARLNCNGFSTLVYASHYGHSAIVRLLMQHNAPDVCDSSGAQVRATSRQTERF